MKVPGSKIVPCQGVLGSNHSLTFGLFTQMSGSGPLGPLVFLNWRISVCLDKVIHTHCASFQKNAYRKNKIAK